jgi:CubicO group peptidase (beta-lactamase class C family)
MDRMWTPAKLNDGKVLQYGLGWRIDGQVVSHSGAQQGCRTSMTIDRERKLTVVVLTNTSGRHAPAQLGTSIAALWR